MYLYFVSNILSIFVWLTEANQEVDYAAIKVDSIEKRDNLARAPTFNIDSRMYSYDYCDTFGDCEGTRYCYDPDAKERCDGGYSCFCSSYPYTNCSTSADCLSNDRCFQDTPTGHCISCAAGDDAYGLEPVDEGNCENDENGSNINPGYAFEDCHKDTDCVAPRECLGRSYVSCNTLSDWCYCTDPSHDECTTSDDCLENDRCVDFDGYAYSYCVSCYYKPYMLRGTFVDEGNCESFPSSPTETNPAKPSNVPSKSSTPSILSTPYPTWSSTPTVSKTPEPAESTTSIATATATFNLPISSSPEQSPSETTPSVSSPQPSYNQSTSPHPRQPFPFPNVCIAADTLVGLDTTDLVFADHRRASVLCDQFDSCATPGHMVQFKGYAMCMKEYCAVDGIRCVKRTKYVNSPKMRMGLRIQSKSKHLKFTALAASKETWLETTLLATLMRLGA